MKRTSSASPEDQPPRKIPKHTHTTRILGAGFALVEGFVLLEGDTMRTFLEALPKDTLEGLFEEYELNKDYDSNINMLGAILHPGNMVGILYYF